MLQGEPGSTKLVLPAAKVTDLGLRGLGAPQGSTGLVLTGEGAQDPARIACGSATLTASLRGKQSHASTKDGKKEGREKNPNLIGQQGIRLFRDRTNPSRSAS